MLSIPGFRSFFPLWITSVDKKNRELLKVFFSRSFHGLDLIALVPWSFHSVVIHRLRKNIHFISAIEGGLFYRLWKSN